MSAVGAQAGLGGGLLWPCGKNGEKKGRGLVGHEREARARRDWLGTSDGPIDDEPSRLAVWHKWLRRAGGACAFLWPSISIHSSLPDLRPSHGARHARKRCLRSFQRVIISDLKSGCQAVTLASTEHRFFADCLAVSMDPAGRGTREHPSEQ